jgi:ABC-type multidrug transport system permease subunit
MRQGRISRAEAFFSCMWMPYPVCVVDLINPCLSSLLWAAISSLSEIPALFSQRAIVVKHAKAAMYHPFIEAVALTIVDIPITFVTIMAFSLILYFMVGLQSSASQFL